MCRLAEAIRAKKALKEAAKAEKKQAEAEKLAVVQAKEAELLHNSWIAMVKFLSSRDGMGQVSHRGSRIGEPPLTQPLPNSQEVTAMFKSLDADGSGGESLQDLSRLQPGRKEGGA